MSADDPLRARLLSSLSRHERLIVIMHYVDGLSDDEIAAVLDTTPECVASALRRLRTRCRRIARGCSAGDVPRGTQIKTGPR